MERLSAIVRELEDADLPLERNVALYKEGKSLVQSCRILLEEARNEVLLCSGKDDEAGNAPDPFSGRREDAEAGNRPSPLSDQGEDGEEGEDPHSLP
jgi:exodeoxyribonuclease VII small subunit